MYSIVHLLVLDSLLVGSEIFYILYFFLYFHIFPTANIHDIQRTN